MKIVGPLLEHQSPHPFIILPCSHKENYAMIKYINIRCANDFNTYSIVIKILQQFPTPTKLSELDLY